MRLNLVNKQAIDLFIKENPNWKITDKGLFQAFIFNDFLKAMAFMNRCAVVAERDNHHPEWANIYNKVEVNLITHEVFEITTRDFKLAKEMDSIAKDICQ